jgi:hypothetical protein
MTETEALPKHQSSHGNRIVPSRDKDFSRVTLQNWD